MPEGVELRTAAAVMLQGMTAHYLTASTFPLAKAHTCLVHAAAGGVGLLLVQMAKQRGARVIAVGTTVVRALESAAGGGTLAPYLGDSSLFIVPGFRFRVVDAMLTNFHLPESTLLMLVSAFAGKETILEAYRHAIEKRYRFFSYGDAMLIER